MRYVYYAACAPGVPGATRFQSALSTHSTPDYIAGRRMCSLARPVLSAQHCPRSNATCGVVLIILFYVECLFLSSTPCWGALWPEANDSQRGTLAGGGTQFGYILVLHIPPDLLHGGSAIHLPILPILPYRRPNSGGAIWESIALGRRLSA